MLTYARIEREINEDYEFPYMKIGTTVKEYNGKWIVARELHQSGIPHYHVLIEFKKRMQTRNPRKFDIDGYHPNWKFVRTTPWKMHDYVCKQGDIKFSSLERPLELPNTKPELDVVWGTIVNQETKPDFLAKMKECVPKHYVTAYNNVAAYASAHYKEEMMDYTSPDVVADEETTKAMAIWMDGYIRGLDDGGSNNFSPKERCALSVIIFFLT